MTEANVNQTDQADSVACCSCGTDIKKNSRWYEWWEENMFSDTDRSVPIICMECYEWQTEQAQ